MGGRRTIIRNQVVSVDSLSMRGRLGTSFLKQTQHRKTNQRPKKTVIAAYIGVFAFVISIIAVGYQPPQPAKSNSSVSSVAVSPQDASSLPDKPSVDELVATDVASKLAEATNMAIATNVANLSVSLAAKDELAQTNDSAIVKPQVVQPTASRREMTNYVAKTGDTVTKVAADFGLKTETVRWANNLASDALTVGRTLVIPPIDGVVYTVRAGDTVDSLAGSYATNKERIVSFNDLEISGLQPGSKIIIPGGVLPENQRPGYQAPTSRPTPYSGGYGYRVNSGIGGTSAGNRYAWGNCTWYAYERRAALGMPVGSFWGNANTWAYYARQDGYLVDRSPSFGAVLVDTSGGFGHVAVVESVGSNGDIVVSEMNNYAYGGFGVTDRRTISAGQAAAYWYIH